MFFAQNGYNITFFEKANNSISSRHNEEKKLLMII